MFNPASIESFVDYMGKVMADAEYAGKIRNANRRRGLAFNNASRKIGMADGVVYQLQRLFSVSPSLIPDSVLDTYLELVNQFGVRRTVLSLPDIKVITENVEKVLKQLDEERSMAIELADRFEASENIVIVDGKIDFAATIKAMLEAEEITQAEAEVMKKYKKDILPEVKTNERSEKELQEERDQLIEAVKKSTVDESRYERESLEYDLVKRLKALLQTDGVNDLSTRDVENLLRLIDNINNGYVPHYAQLMVEKLQANVNAMLE
jgi:hypothetical protein